MVDFKLFERFIFTCCSKLEVILHPAFSLLDFLGASLNCCPSVSIQTSVLWRISRKAVTFFSYCSTCNFKLEIISPASFCNFDFLNDSSLKCGHPMLIQTLNAKNPRGSWDVQFGTLLYLGLIHFDLFFVNRRIIIHTFLEVVFHRVYRLHRRWLLSGPSNAYIVGCL